MVLYNIAQLASGMKNVDANFIVLEKVDDRVLRDGSSLVRYRVADHTGSVILPVFHPLAGAIKGGDILRIVNGYATIHEQQLQLYVGPGSLNKVGEFTMLYSDAPDMSARVKD
eukprot:m.42463 g.42463  ORF g.42463 m.42463 type:complete len:113 (-) comp7060_c0_seq1:140-478(-)